MRKVLVFGGSFDPPHNEHIRLLRRALSAVSADNAVVMPAFQSPFKAGHNAAAKQRTDMIRLAVAGIKPAPAIDLFEIKRGKKTYTYQTIKYLLKKYRGAEIYFLAGSDSAENIENWKNYKEYKDKIKLVVGKRGKTAKKMPPNILTLKGVFKPVSSTQTREHILTKGKIPACVAPKIARYIKRNKLYGINLLSGVKKLLPDEKYRHSVSVAKLALKLALVWGVKPASAFKAGILHDIGKRMSGGQMIKYCIKNKLRPPYFKETAENAPSLLHTFISADMAVKLFGETDAQILSAIRKHTVSGKTMSVLDKILFVADYASTDRKHMTAKTIRNLAMKNLDLAFEQAYRNKKDYTLSKKLWICPKI